MAKGGGLEVTGFLLLVGLGEGAHPTYPEGPAGHPQALQLRWIRVGGVRDAAGHGCLNRNQGPLSALAQVPTDCADAGPALSLGGSR